jgi:hypothetical protein
MLGDRETKPGAAILPGRRDLGLAEGLEQPALLLFGQAYTGIADDKRDFEARGSDLERDAAFMGKLSGISAYETEGAG